MMIQDGCFILELMCCSATLVDDYAPYDPIFRNHRKLHVMAFLRLDMLLLENQVPLLVLETLLAVDGKSKQEENWLNKLIHHIFFRDGLVTNVGKCLHILDVYQKTLLLEVPRPEKHHKKGHNESHKAKFILCPQKQIFRK
ncbi:hypothetical protein Fot_16548 [Forsythia ovata]|uniref:Uncharacterized protein n=1 Tax=Forsythia ovata TaxID=205694 RepID=A0ABD1WCV2_9LAMI